MQLILKKPFPVGRDVYDKGRYQIPDQISETLAKCAAADGYGEIKGVKDTKAQGGAPENK